MTTNFFQQLTSIPVNGTWVLTIENDNPEYLIVAVRFEHKDCKDRAKYKIADLILRGSASELDEVLLERIQKPIQQTSEVYVGMANYAAQLEQAKKEQMSQREKDTKENKDKTDKEKKFTKAMKTVDELEEQGKFREAWTAVPDPSEYPEHAEKLRERRSELSDQFAPELF